MPVRDILLLGNPVLYQACAPVAPDAYDALRPLVQDLHDTLHAFRARHGVGRAIAAPQIGVTQRVVYMDHGGEQIAFVNPVLSDFSEELMTLWDDCMSFPDLLVHLERHRRCRITWHDLDGREHTRLLEDGLSELLQHECDHLDGVLAVSRALGPEAFAYRSELAPE